MSIPAVGLTSIISKIRRITARPSPNQITDVEIREYVDTYYLYDFPQELKSFNLKTIYSFTTVPNEDTYTFPRNDYYSVEGPMYASGFPLLLSENRDQFYRNFPQLLYSEDFSTTTAGIGAGPYAALTTTNPVLRRSVTLSVDDGTGTYLVATDVPTAGSNTGTFVGDVAVGGTINYLTGAISLTWDAVPAAGQVINVKYFPYQASRPLSVLFYHDDFILRPVPDEVYTVTMQAFIKPTALLTTESPYLDEWFELLAYGASLKIFAENMDMQNYQMLLPIYQEKLRQCERRTLMQIKNQRTSTIYVDSNLMGPSRSLTM